MSGKLRASELLKSPHIKVVAKITAPGRTNGKPNLKEEIKYVLPPSAKKIATYIRNQIFGSDLLTQAEGIDINWLTPSLGGALEEAIYDKESFIYIHRYNNKVYLELLRKCDIHDLVQKYDQIISFKLYEDFEIKDEKITLIRDVHINEDGTTTILMKAIATDNRKREREISIETFNKLTENEYDEIYTLPYEVLINIDVGQEFFKDSEKLLNEEMIVLNTIAEEIEKTKTRIVTSQHFQTGDITTKWQPGANMYEVKTLTVNNIQDYFTLMPGDEEHKIFEFIQGDVRIEQYQQTFKFYDYQIIQMANLSPATFGYEKDSYQNVASVDLNANTTEMTIEAIKKQIEPQVNKLLENVVKLQQAIGTEENAIPADLVWDYGLNERFDDMKKISVLQRIQQVARVPYSTRAKIIVPILNKLIDEPIKEIDIVNAHKEEELDIDINYGEI